MKSCDPQGFARVETCNAPKVEKNKGKRKTLKYRDCYSAYTPQMSNSTPHGRRHLQRECGVCRLVCSSTTTYCNAPFLTQSRDCPLCFRSLSLKYSCETLLDRGFACPIRQPLVPVVKGSFRVTHSRETLERY